MNPETLRTATIQLEPIRGPDQLIWACRRKHQRPKRPNQSLFTAHHPRPPQPKTTSAGIAPSHFELREYGTIYQSVGRDSVEPKSIPHSVSHGFPESSRGRPTVPELIFTDASRRLWLYHGNCLELPDAIAAKYPQEMPD